MAATPGSPATTSNPTDPGLIAQLLGSTAISTTTYDFIWGNLADAAGNATGDVLANIVPIPAYDYSAALPLSFPNALDQTNFSGNTLIVPDILRMRTSNSAMLKPFATATDPTTGIGELRAFAKLDGGGVATTYTLVPCYLDYVPGYAPSDQVLNPALATRMALTPVTRPDPATMWARGFVYRLMLNSNLPARVVRY